MQVVPQFSHFQLHELRPDQQVAIEMLTGVTEERAGLQLSRAAIAVVLLTVHTNMLADRTDSSCSVERSLNTDVILPPHSSLFPCSHTVLQVCYIEQETEFTFFSF